MPQARKILELLVQRASCNESFFQALCNVNLLEVIIFMLQILLVFYFVELLQQAYLAKKQDLCETAAAAVSQDYM